MKIGSFVTAFLLMIAHIQGASLTQIDFYQRGEISTVELNFEGGDYDVKKYNIVDDKQIILDLKNTKASQKVMRAFDTSEFSGAVVYVSAYEKPGNRNDTRIAIQLRDNVRSILNKSDNKILLEIENRFGVFEQAKLYDNNQTGQLKQEKASAGSKVNIPKSASIVDILENITMSGRKKYVGKRISLDVRNVPVTDILKMVAEASGFNIIVSKKVEKKDDMTLNLIKTPWDQILDTVLEINKLVAKKNGTILMVQTLEEARKDQEEEQKAKRQSLRQEPLLTKLFLLSYATTKDVMAIVKKYSTENRGDISEDVRTNTLIVKDTADVLEKMKRIIQLLDTQTPQVLIESKIVEIQEEYKKELGLDQGIRVGYDPVTPINGDGATANSGPGFTFGSAPSDTNNFFSVAVAKYQRLLNLDFTLKLIEEESKGKLISTPKVVTQNKQKATLSSQETRFVVETSFDADGQVTNENKEYTADLLLEVTPQITNDGGIILDIEVKKEEFSDTTNALGGPESKTRNQIVTNVLVDNGSTIVLGGLYEYQKSMNHSGVPYLKDVPLLGWLFRTPYNPSVFKREVIIFITPRIVNQEAAGLGDNS